MEKFEGLSKKYAEEGWLIPEADLTFGRILGRGASGTTYMGELHGETVAIKAYSVSILRNDSVSVKNEMDIMARVKHDNIVQFRGLCLSMDPAAAALVTSFATGGELGDALYKRNTIKKGGDAARFKVAIGLARGLKFLHENGLIHRDIKPANVLLDANGEPLLTDFGFSRMVDVSGDMTGETGRYVWWGAAEGWSGEVVAAGLGEGASGWGVAQRRRAVQHTGRGVGVGAPSLYDALCWSGSHARARQRQHDTFFVARVARSPVSTGSRGAQGAWRPYRFVKVSFSGSVVLLPAHMFVERPVGRGHQYVFSVGCSHSCRVLLLTLMWLLLFRLPLVWIPAVLFVLCPPSPSH